MAEPVERLLGWGREVLRRHQPLVFDLPDRGGNALQEPFEDAFERGALGYRRGLGAGREQRQQPLVDALQGEGGFGGLAGLPLVRGGEERRQRGGESRRAPADGAVARNHLHGAVVERGDPDHRLVFVRRVADEIEEAAPRYGRLRNRPSVTEVAPDIAQRDPGMRVPRARVDKLEVGPHGVAQRLGAVRVSHWMAPGRAQAILQFCPVGDQRLDGSVSRGSRWAFQPFDESPDVAVGELL